MGDEIKFNKNVQTTGIKKADLLNELKNQGIQDNVASTIFEKFNTNTVGDSADVLDMDEQVGLLAFLKNIAGNDETITKEEFDAKSSMTDGIGLDTFNKTVTAFQNLVDKDTKDNKDVTFDKNGEVKVDGKTYAYGDNAKFETRTMENNNKKVTQKLRQKYDLVSLNDTWKNSRDDGNKIASGDEKYKDIKSATSAKEVLDRILKAKNIETKNIKPDDMTKLLQTMIKFNPSIFDRETGNVWIDADWTKLDFPATTDISKMISDSADLSGVSDSVKYEKASTDKAEETDKADETDKEEEDNTPEVKVGDDNITVSSGGIEYASIKPSNGVFSCDAVLRIKHGKNKGKYKFVADDDDNLNFGNFKVKRPNGGDPRISVEEYNIKKLVGTDENGAIVEFIVKTNNGLMEVVIGKDANGKDKTVPLEKFLAMQKEEAEDNAE